GKLIPQLTFAQPNILNMISTLKSSRSTIFAAGTVRMDGSPVACTTTYIPMLACGEPMPLPLVLTANTPRSVYVGMNAADLISGIVSCAASCLAAYLTRGGGLLGGDDYVKKLLKELLTCAMKTGASIVDHFLVDPRYPVTFDLTIPLPGADNAKVKVS